MYGEVIAVVAAVLCAASMIAAAGTLKDVDPIGANTLRILFGALSMLPIAVATGELGFFNSDPTGSFLVILAAVIGLGIGDTSLLRSVTYIGVSRSYTVAYSYPLFTVILATVFLGEPFNYKYLIGSVLIFFGVVNALGGVGVEVRVKRSLGFMFSLATALSWAVGTVLVTQGVKSISIISANTIRFPIVFLILLPIFFL
ncbi:MAG: DMT family transporter [Candidatus Bathyarchaeia archaeon]